MSKRSINNPPKRVTLGQKPYTLPSLDLLAVQKESYQWLLEKGIAVMFEEISPIEDYSGKNWTLSFGKYHFD